MRELFTCLLIGLPGWVFAQAPELPVLELMDVFELEYVSDPQLRPDGEEIAYLRNGFDVMTDAGTAELWTIRADGTLDRPLVAGRTKVSSPRWSPAGDKLLYLSDGGAGGETQLYVYYADSRTSARVTHVRGEIRDPLWSPDGRRIAFTASVPYTVAESVVSLPAKPEGAEWAEPARYVDKLQFRSDGRGFVKPERQQLFVVEAGGGSAQQLTDAAYAVALTDWTPDGKTLIVTANPNDSTELQPLNSDIVGVDALTGETRLLVATPGPDQAGRVSPDGKTLAYLSAVDELNGYENSVLYTREIDDTPGEGRALTAELDRSITDFAWSDGGLLVEYDDRGDTYLASVGLAGGEPKQLVDHVGGLSLGRPYSGGSFSSNAAGEIAFTRTGTAFPAELGVYADGDISQLTDLNADLLGTHTLGEVSQLQVTSSAGGQAIQAWVVRPPGFDASKSYPLILEIHGGPYANYGDRFSMEAQLYAAAGYVVVYANPRGSTSYGAEFANLIEDDYPGEDYDDLMSVVDGVIAAGSIDTSQLFVTGGSGGGVLTAWIVGKTDRFRAAVVAKPVINWTSFVLYADNTPFFSKYWFSKPPWEDQAAYWNRSPLSLVGNVTTPTMLLTGESDYRTPIGESEQYYSALKLRGVPTAMLRIPGAGHSITARPTGLMAKVSGVLGWFERYRPR